ncbi:hypothetical protein V1478_016680 [Vespula squamosa]|uniref:Uncharacterized protein n=1 Tax=Vespula squamosa TaxID=30214 RepID=A0ABD2A0G4_VESSQ
MRPCSSKFSRIMSGSAVGVNADFDIFLSYSGAPGTLWQKEAPNFTTNFHINAGVVYEYNKLIFKQ